MTIWQVRSRNLDGFMVQVCSAFAMFETRALIDCIGRSVGNSTIDRHFFVCFCCFFVPVFVFLVTKPHLLRGRHYNRSSWSDENGLHLTGFIWKRVSNFGTRWSETKEYLVRATFFQPICPRDNFCIDEYSQINCAKRIRKNKIKYEIEC